MPKWFVRMFAIVMILACCATAYFVYQHQKLSYAVEDARVSLETSRARESKQEYEYEQVQKELPQAQEELAEVQPKSEALAKEVETLRETRTKLQEENAGIEEKIVLAEASATDLQASYNTMMLDLAEKVENLESKLTDAMILLVNSRSISTTGNP